MAGASRVGDILGPGGVLVGPFSPDVLINGRPAALFGIVYTPHPCCGAKGCPPAHCGGPTFDTPDGVTINGLIPVRKGTGIGLCGHSVKTGSSDVLIGGGIGLGTFSGLISGGISGGLGVGDFTSTEGLSPDILAQAGF